MPQILYSPKMSPLLKTVVGMSCAYAWITGYGRDVDAMTASVKRGYEGEYTQDLHRYDEFGLDHYIECAELLLEELNNMDLRDKDVLDVGCGTGILSFCVLERGAAKVVCSELSELMLNKCRKSASERGYGPDKVEFLQCDAANLPFEEESFDAVVSGMVLGTVPDQRKAVSEIARVLRPGGKVAISTHGHMHYMECGEIGSRVFLKPRYISSAFGVRPEYWTLDEKKAAKLLEKAGLKEIDVKRRVGKEHFQTADQAYYFYSSTSGFFWSGSLPDDKRDDFFKDVRECFNRKNICWITTDIVYAYGKKPA